MKNVIIGKQKEESEEYKNVMQIVEDKNIPVQVVKKGDQLKIDSNVYFDVLYPEDTLRQDGLNNNSLVLKLNYGDFKMIFTGDIEKEAEKQILSSYPESNVLEAIAIKIAHHGSQTSTIQEFLKAVSPKIAFIRSGRK